MNKPGSTLFLLMLALPAFGHPGGGIVALSEDSAIFADPTENFIWLVERSREPKRLVSKFHGHWLTRGLDGRLYVEAFQESGGAWSSAAFRLDLPGAKLTEVAHRDELGALAFAVDGDGALVFQRGASLVSRRDGRESPFRHHPDRPAVGNVTAYVWGPAGELFYADRNQIRQIDRTGLTTLVAEIGGKVPEPRIWNATETPSIFSLAVDSTGTVLAAVPDLAQVYRIGKDRVPVEISGSEDGWRATGVATFGNSVFLLESDSRASTSPRVRIVRPDGRIEFLTVPRRAARGGSDGGVEERVGIYDFRFAICN